MPIFALVLTLLGCVLDPALTGAGGDTATDGPCADRFIQISTAAEPSIVLESGANLQMTHDSAGGWTLDIAFVVAGLSDTVSVSGSVSRTDTSSQISQAAEPALYAVAEYSDHTCSGSPTEHRLFLDHTRGTLSPEAWVCDLEDVELALCLDIGPAEGPRSHVAQCFAVVATLDPIDVSTCAAL